MFIKCPRIYIRIYIMSEDTHQIRYLFQNNKLSPNRINLMLDKDTIITSDVIDNTEYK